MSALDELILKLITEGATEAAGDLQKMATALDGITKAEKETVATEKEHAKTSVSLKGTMTELKAGLDVASMAVGYLGQAYNALVGDTIKYAGTVKDLALNLSLSSEETSKLISVGSKFGVSSETLTSSLQMMVKRGLAPSLDGLAKMSDDMMAIQDPVKRAAALTEVFGRGWTNLMPILEKGGAAIKAVGSEAEKMGLVLSQKDVDAVENLEIKMNTLNMKVEGLKTKIGTALIPVLDDAATGLTYVAQAMSGVSNKSDEYEQAIIQLTLRFGANSDQVKKASEEYRNYLYILQQSTTMTDANDRAQQRQAASTGALIPLTQQQTDGMKALALANQAGGQAQQDFNKWLSDEQNAAAAAALSMKELTTQTIYNTAAAGLDANSALVLAEKMGLVDKSALGAAKTIMEMKGHLKAGDITINQYADSVNRMQAAIASLTDKNVEITLTTIMQEINRQKVYERGVEGGLIGGRAYGGAVGAGVPYIIGEHGRETYVPQQAGIVVPNNITSNVTNNITTDRMGVALAMARAQQMAAEARM